jgi:hypothetical protein
MSCFSDKYFLINEMISKRFFPKSSEFNSKIAGKVKVEVDKLISTSFCIKFFVTISNSSSKFVLE